MWTVRLVGSPSMRPLSARSGESCPRVAISITALLDWFRSGTAVAKVIDQVDEFVPQFYDLGGPEDRGGEAIASRVDAARWGPVFNRFRKPFRVGISTFGRVRVIRRAADPAARHLSVVVYRDIAPIEIAINPALELQTARNQANELLLNYRASRRTRIEYNEFAPGDIIQFILSTPEAVRAAVESARQMSGYLAGVVFFRWPGSDERLAMQPDEVMMAAGLTVKDGSRTRVLTVNRRCAAVECVDVFLSSADPFSPKQVRYRIRSSLDLEYFLPEKNLPVRMTGPAEIELSLPPYCGRGRLYLGRAVTAREADFEVEEEP